MNASIRSTRSRSGFAYNQRQSIPKQIAWLFLLLVGLSRMGFAQSTTTISGTVYMPNGTVPLPNVLVYVTNGSVTLPASGATCTSSSVTAAEGCITSSTITPTVVTSGTGVYAYTTTAVDGTFTLSGVPEGNSYTLVIQSGKWLNEFTEPSSGTLSGPISGLQLNMPTVHSSTANIPLIAIQTGSADALECVFRDIGVATTEFTDDSVSSGPSFGGRIHLYKGNGAEMSSNTPASATLQTQAKLNSYDMVMFPCEGSGTTGANSTTIPYLINYTSLGGRVFTTHNSDAWLDTTNTGANGYYFYSAGSPSPMTWGSAANSVTPDPGYGSINTSFSDGNTLAAWLYENGYSYGASGNNTGTENEVEISTLRFNVDTVNAPAQAWLTFPSQNSQTYNSAYNGGSPIMQFSFNTPWGASAANQFGRVLYNEYHVENVSESGSPIFPNECPTLSGASQVPQEKMLEFAIFDLSAAVTPVVLPTASIAITTNPSNSIFDEGDSDDTITVDVTNTSSTVALPNNITLAVTLPAGLTATAMADTSSGSWVCTVGTLTCTNASGIAASASDAATITVTVSGSAAGNNSSVTGSVSATVSSPNFSSNVISPLTITVDRHAAVTWATPAAITAGTPLSGTQLDAVGNTDGTYVYRLNSTSGTVITSGTVLPPGANTLWVTFTPSDQDSYPGTATASVTVTVNSTTATAGNPAPVSIGSEPVGSSTSQNVTFTFTGAGSIGTPLVVTQGATGLDFTDAGPGTCDTNGTSYAYSISSTCTVAVTFAPLHPGLRYGAVLLEDASGNVLATAYLTGTGTGAQILFPPGTQTMLTPDTTTYWPEGLAVDSQSNLFFVDGNSNSYAGAVIELPWLGSSYGAALSPTSLYLPGASNYASGAMAEDGAGNLYVGLTDYITSTGNILKFPWNGSGYGSAISLGSGLILPTGIVVDGAGNLFFSDSSAQLIAELPWTGSSENNGYGSQTTLANAAALGGSVLPQGIAVDSAENVFFLAATSSTTAELMKIPYVSGSYSASFVTIDNTLYSPYGITIDTNGNIYVADSNQTGTSTPIYEYVLSSGSYAARTQLLTTPYGGGAPMALDGTGNLYLDWNSGDGSGAIYKQNRNVLPAIAFPTATAQGTADTTDNPLSFTLLNYGNANLSIASEAISTGSASFSFDASTSCAHGGDGSLAANVSCSYALDFTPASTGSIPGSLLLTDNNLNVSAAAQLISLSGTGIATTAISFTLPASTTLTAGTVGVAYGPVIFQATGGTSPYQYTISGGALPAGMSLSSAGSLTGTPTASGAFSITVLATDTDSVTGSQTYSLSAGKATATITVGDLAQTYSGSPLPATATTAPAGLTVSFTYNGSESAPTAPGSYTVVATINDTNYQGSGTATLVISKGTATVALGNLTQTYTGSPLSATATTAPAGLTVSFTYNGSETAPTAPGSYTVVATINSTNYQGSGTATLVISKGTATVTLGNLIQTYTGSPLSATATTVPAGLTVSFTYNGSETAPTAPGRYTVVATINDTNYQGSGTATLVISKRSATVTLGNLTQTYTGSPLSATATTVPGALTVTFTYNGSGTAPTAGGSYTVVATVSNSEYAGSATGTMTIEALTPSVRLSSSTNPAVAQTGVTFTASVSSTVGRPTGTISFLDSTTLLGQGTLSAGVATLATSSLSDGPHSITAVYNGDTNFVAVTSAALSQSILDFSLTPGSGSGSSSSVPTQTADPGGSATYPLNIVPTAGTIFPTPVLLTVTGMPAGATAVITPSSWTQLTGTSWTFPANTPLTTVTLTIQLPSASTSMKKEYPPSGKLPPILWGMLLLPFAVRMRCVGKRLRGILFTLLLTAAGLGALSILSACASGNGFFGQQQSSYTVTVTATSGPLTRSTNLTLNVE
jgi:sugar lactone lactonase YvrE